MKSRIYTGTVQHTRKTPVSHQFAYPVYTFAFDLDELDELDRTIKGFSHNKKNITSIHDEDYLYGEGSIREKILRILEENGCADGVERIELLTTARYLRRVFNPVSFYYCYRADESIRCIVAEVNNTFHERHVYILHDPVSVSENGTLQYTHGKEFYVSPFNNMEGTYRFSFSRLAQTLSIGIVLSRGEEGRVLIARLSGTARPMTSTMLRKTIWQFPLSALITFPRISWEASKLYFRKHLKIQTRPPLENPHSLPVPKPGQKKAMKMVLRLLGRIRKGCLQVELPDRTVRVYGDPGAAKKSLLKIHDYELFANMIFAGDIGFGEGFMNGRWDSDDLTGLLTLLVENMACFPKRNQWVSRAGRAINRWRHVGRRNTKRMSRKNIQEHYDLGNDFFSRFLDETMLYSCAYFQTPHESLVDAQKNKVHKLMQLADIQKDDHVLEIGCGWGGFAIEAVRHTGCRVTGITLSEKQKMYVEERVKEEGLQNQIDVQLIDYRDMTGSFDRIVSIEMLEAVGHEYFGTFFRACDSLLKPGGRMALQVITIPDERYDAYRKSTDWIQKHIFPGGMLPSMRALQAAMNKYSSLQIEHQEDIGLHYAETLKRWRQAFMMHRDEFLQHGYDEQFLRKWEYYFCYCEAGFSIRYIHDLHLLLTRS